MSGIIRFRDGFTEKLVEIGSILSTFAEMFLINGAFLIQNSLEDSKIESKEGVIYVMDNDGIVFEWKPNVSNKKSLFYRKQKFDPKQFLRSYMYSMTTYIDEGFTNYDFLKWD